MSEKLSNNVRNQIKLQSKRNVELWIYSFADMYLILAVFFIVISVVYANKVKAQRETPPPVASLPTAGRGPAAVKSDLNIEFAPASTALSETARENLRLLLPAVKGMKTGVVEVEGYADGSPLGEGSGFSSNLDLSNQRAVKVAEWFIANGVPARSIRTFSYGDGHQWKKSQVSTNRRVLVKISSNGAE